MACWSLPCYCLWSEGHRRLLQGSGNEAEREEHPSNIWEVSGESFQKGTSWYQALRVRTSLYLWKLRRKFTWLECRDEMGKWREPAVRCVQVPWETRKYLCVYDFMCVYNCTFISLKHVFLLWTGTPATFQTHSLIPYHIPGPRVKSRGYWQGKSQSLACQAPLLGRWNNYSVTRALRLKRCPEESPPKSGFLKEFELRLRRQRKDECKHWGWGKGTSECKGTVVAICFVGQLLTGVSYPVSPDACIYLHLTHSLGNLWYL